jgi:hypothetical protein
VVRIDIMHSPARHLERWPLLLAVALAAMTAAHALELAMENASLFGDGRAGYSHVAQGPIVDLAIALFLFAAGVLAIRLVRGVWPSNTQSDWMLPVLQEIRAMSVRGAALRIVSLQFPALVAAEFAEQRLSGIVHPSMAAVFGVGHLTAPFVQFAVGIIAAWVIVAFSRTVCAHAQQLARAGRAVATLFVAVPRRPTVRIALRSLLAICSSRPKRRAPLAFRIANRPPPAIATARA